MLKELTVRLPCKSVHLLNANLINFIVDIDARQIHPISDHHINKLIGRAVITEEHFSVEHLEGRENRLNHFFIAFGEHAGAVEGQTAAFLDFEVNVGLLLVQTDADTL